MPLRRFAFSNVLSGVGMAALLAACSSTTPVATAPASNAGSTTAPTTSASSSPPGTALSPTFAPGKYAWTQFDINGRVTVRALVDGECPMAHTDSRVVQMHEFKPPAPPGFPHRTCAADVPPSADRITVEGHELPGAPKKLDRIVVVGDIGCYLKTSKQQNCLDPNAFPAKQLSDQIAAARPDLVVFVGDIYYSQAECPGDKRSECGGVPTGDRWETWAYDFFDPYRSALDSAPWIFSRGNHEGCATPDDDGGDGWFQVLAPQPDSCDNFTQPYVLDVLDQKFVVFDSALANDDTVDPTQVATYEDRFRRMHFLVKDHENVWFVDHRPMWAAGMGNEKPFYLNATLQTADRAAGNVMNNDIDLVLSGHMHQLGLFTFADGRPAQIVSGGGGTELDKKGGSFAGQTIDGTTISYGETNAAFGYMQFDRTGPTDWNIDAVTLGGAVWKHCALAKRTLTCP